MTEEHKHKEEHIEHHKKEHEHEKPEHKHVEHHKEHEPKKVKIKKTDTWKILTLILVVLFLISLFTHGFSGKAAAGKTVNKELAANSAVQYINTYLMGGAGSAKLKEVTEKDNLYMLTLDVNGMEYYSYVTKDGKYLFPQGVDIQETPEIPETPTQQPTQDITKSDKPKVEVFVMSHCPYGTQIEKGLIPVMETLGDKADIEIKFVNYAMHGEKEVKEQWNQYCIETKQNDKYLPYLKCFLKEGDGEGCLTEAKIDTAKLETCKTAADTKFKIMENLENKQGTYPAFLIHDAENKQYGVSGSPTLVINGQKVSSARDSASLLKTICSTFNTPPAECNTELSSASPSAGFGFENTGSATAASCG